MIVKTLHKSWVQNLGTQRLLPRRVELHESHSKRGPLPSIKTLTSSSLLRSSTVFFNSFLLCSWKNSRYQCLHTNIYIICALVLVLFGLVWRGCFVYEAGAHIPRLPSKLIYSQGWPCTSRPPVSLSPVLILQEGTTVPFGSAEHQTQGFVRAKQDGAGCSLSNRIEAVRGLWLGRKKEELYQPS